MWCVPPESDPSPARCPACLPACLPAEDLLLPVLNQRAHEILNSYNHLRGPVTAPLNISAVAAGLPDAGALFGHPRTGRCCLWPCAGCAASGARPLLGDRSRPDAGSDWCPPPFAEAAKDEEQPVEGAQESRSQILIGHLASYEASGGVGWTHARWQLDLQTICWESV